MNKDVYINKFSPLFFTLRRTLVRSPRTFAGGTIDRGYSRRCHHNGLPSYYGSIRINALNAGIRARIGGLINDESVHSLFALIKQRPVRVIQATITGRRRDAPLMCD